MRHTFSAFAFVLTTCTLLACGAGPSNEADGGAHHHGPTDGGTTSSDAGGSTTNDGGVTPLEDAGTADGGAPPVSYAADIQPIWNAYCVSCHNAQTAASQGRLDLSAPGSRQRLLQPYEGFCNPAGGGDLLEYDFVEPGDPSTSVVWIKLTTDLLAPTSPQCGREMPMGLALAFSEPELADKVRRWILQGAPNS